MDLCSEGVGVTLIDDWSELVFLLDHEYPTKGSSADVLKREILHNPNFGESREFLFSGNVHDFRKLILQTASGSRATCIEFVRHAELNPTEN
jgi:hypothetical protein